MSGIDHIDSTGRGDVAADLLRANDYDVVVIEAVVPYGDERLLAHIARCHPSVSGRLVVITAGPIAPVVMQDIEGVQPRALLEKPFDVVTLAGAVREILAPAPRHLQPPHAA